MNPKAESSTPSSNAWQTAIAGKVSGRNLKKKMKKYNNQTSEGSRGRIAGAGRACRQGGQRFRKTVFYRGKHGRNIKGESQKSQE